MFNEALQVCTERDSVPACQSKPQLASSRMAIASLHCLFWPTDFLISLHAEHFFQPFITHSTRAPLKNSMGHLQPISDTPLGFECSGTLGKDFYYFGTLAPTTCQLYLYKRSGWG